MPLRRFTMPSCEFEPRVCNQMWQQGHHVQTDVQKLRRHYRGWHGIGAIHADMHIYKHVCAEYKKQPMSSTAEISDKFPVTSMDEQSTLLRNRVDWEENDSYYNTQDYNQDIPASCCMLCDAVFLVLWALIRYACLLRCAQVAMHHNPASWQLSLQLHRRSHGDSKSTA